MKRFLVATFLLITVTFRVSAVDTSAKSAILYEANTGAVLYEKNSEEQRPIASTTKIMTAIIVIENGNMEDIVEIQPEQEGVQGTSLYLKKGEKISVKTLLYGLMLRSGNDAAEALARYVAGDIESFVKLMNEKAKELNMENTNFANPHGLPNDNHYSTATDMARLTAYAMKNETFRKIVSTKSYAAEGRSFENHNKLLKMNSEIDGVKTGFTTAAGRCLVSSGKRGNMRLVAVTLFDPNDWDDHLNLYKHGFENFKNINTCTKNQSITVLPVAGLGKVEVLAEKGFQCTVSNNDEIKTEIHLPRFRYAPIKKGQTVGEIIVIKNGETIEKINLITAKAVHAPEEKGFFERLINKIKNG